MFKILHKCLFCLYMWSTLNVPVKSYINKLASPWDNYANHYATSIFLNLQCNLHRPSVVIWVPLSCVMVFWQSFALVFKSNRFFRDEYWAWGDGCSFAVHEGKGTKNRGECSVVSNDAVSLLSGPTLMACPLRALQRPWPDQQPVTSHPFLQEENNSGELHVCSNISHSQPVLTLREHTVTSGNHCCRRIPGAPGYFFVMENTHSAEKKIMSHTCFFFFFASDVFPI